MILWVVLFLLIVAISFLLAILSMKDYHEVPHKSNTQYGLFLIRHTANFTPDVLSQLGKLILREGLVFSIERLVKGSQAALILFGPTTMLKDFSVQLNLLELEDYAAKLYSSDISVWEMGIKDKTNLTLNSGSNFFQALPVLTTDEQFCWQIVLRVNTKEGNSFKTQIRAVLLSKDSVRRNELVSAVQGLDIAGLTAVPKPFTKDQMLEFYQTRSFASDSNGPILDLQSVINLVMV